MTRRLATAAARHPWRSVAAWIAAVVVSIAFMMAFAGPMGAFVDRHPTLKVLALNFLILIGLCLVAEGWGHHIPKGYVYFAMGFSIVVEAINIRIRSVQEPVRLHEAYAPESGPGKAERK